MPHRIRIINPNSNTSMTESLRAPIDSLNYSEVRIESPHGSPLQPRTPPPLTET